MSINYEKLEKDINSQIEKRNNAINSIQAKILEEESKIEQANKDMDLALLNDDERLYKTAKHKKTDSEDNIEMYQAKLNRVNDIFSNSEYSGYIDKIMQTHKEDSDKIIKEFGEIISKLNSITNEYINSTSKKNALIEKLNNINQNKSNNAYCQVNDVVRYMQYIKQNSIYNYIINGLW